MQCPSCKSHDIEWHEAGGDAVCTRCGTVCEESTIVSSVEFSEAAGSATVVGQFVSAESSSKYTGGPMNASARSRYGFMRNSRETTLAKGKNAIAEVAGRLRLQNHFIDAAHRLFRYAVQRNFVQGRKTMHVVAVCLYIKCREEKSPHLLIDFSDALSVNVFTLGATYLKFCRLLNIDTPLIDPSLFIHRFANRLNLGKQTQMVCQTALRVVARMKRDWIVTGRRPAGICAAALLIAARSHGFPRTQNDVVKVLRVCGMTVKCRLEEFELTPSAQLTMEELRNDENSGGVLPITEQDPPAFSRTLKALPSTDGGEPPRKKSRRFKAREALYETMAESLQPVDDEAHTQAVLQELPEGQTAVQETEDDEVETFSDIDDSECLGLVLTEAESAKKSKIWTEMHKDYLKDQELKRQRESEAPKGGSNEPKKKKRKAYTKSTVANTSEEAMEQVQKKISKKINYEALAGMFSVGNKGDSSQPVRRRGRSNSVAASQPSVDTASEPAISLSSLTQAASKKQAKTPTPAEDDPLMEEVEEVHDTTEPQSHDQAVEEEEYVEEEVYDELEPEFNDYDDYGDEEY